MGAAVCHRLARDGRAVAVLDLQAAAAATIASAINAHGGRAIAITADITQPEQIQLTAESVRAQLGPINILVNNAGVEAFSPFRSISNDSWTRMLELNLTGHFNVIQAMLSDMIASGWGRIVNFASMAAQTGAANMVHYSAAKGGVIAMTRSLALEFGRHGITVNAVAPGLINTPMAQRAIAADQFPVPFEQMVQSFPIPRIGEPEEAAAAVAFFTSEDAGYITGQLLGINGDTAF